MIANDYILAAESIERRFEFAALPQGWLSIASLVLLFALLSTAILLYRRELRSGLTPRRRILLTVLRCTAICLLAIVWLEPTIATYIHREIESETLILVDTSASMSLLDRYSGPESEALAPKLAEGRDARSLNRSQLAKRALDAGENPLLTRMAAHNSVRVYRFADDLTPVGYISRGGRPELASLSNNPPSSRPTEGPANETVPLETMLAALGRAEGTSTDIGRAIRSAVEMQGDTPIAAVVVLSDGRFNRGEPAEIIARFAHAKKIPVYAVGVGDPAEPRNAAVASLDAPANVFVKDPFQIAVQIKTQGLAGETLAVALFQGDPAASQPLERKTVAVDAAGNVPPVIFKHQLADAGQVRLTAQVEAIEGETVTIDNRREITVRALDNRMRVLLVSGGSSWDYRYLMRLLTRDATMDLSCWLQSADLTSVRDGKTVIDHFPSQPEELAVYDCIILMDPQPGDFTPAWATTVESMIADNGAGLLYVAARAHTPQFVRSPNTRPLVEMLPVVIDPGEAELILNEMGHFQTTAWPVMMPPESAGHGVLTLADSPAENLQAWSLLPGWYWHYPVTRAKPVASVLLRDSNPRMRGPDGGHVLLATQFVGSGRTAFLASDSTWRWRRASEQYFNRFWIQLLRHLVEGKLSAGQKRGLVQTDRTQYAAGDPVIIEARLLDERHQPMRTEEIAAMIQREGAPASAITLKAQPNRPGWYRGRWVPTRGGAYSLKIDLPGGTNTESTVIRHEIRVGQSDLEFRTTSLDREPLRLLASQSAGGQYLDLAQAERLVDLIPGKQVSMVLTGEPVSLWDRWWTLMLLVGLLGTEWFLRKRACLL